METGQREKKMLACSKFSRQKLTDNIACYVLRDRTKRDATKKKVRRLAMKYQGKHSANITYNQELINVVRGLGDSPDIPSERWEERILALGATLRRGECMLRYHLYEYTSALVGTHACGIQEVRVPCCQPSCVVDIHPPWHTHLLVSILS